MAKTSIKTVLEMDLVAYGEVARTLEDHLGVYAVQALQSQIQGFVDQGLTEVGLKRSDAVFATSGDNAMLILNSAEKSHWLARSVAAATYAHNQTKSSGDATRWFRMGCATGDTYVDEATRELAGSTVIRAVRLEAAGNPGTLLVDLATYDALQPDIQRQYGAEISIVGKRGEKYPARPCTFFNSKDSGANQGSATVSPLTEMWDRLDDNLQDAFALAYNEKRRERPSRPVRISTRDLFKALARIDDGALQSILAGLPPDSMPAPSASLVSNQPLVLEENHLLSDCISDSLGAFSRADSTYSKVTPIDMFTDISSHGHGESVEQLRRVGVGPSTIRSLAASIGLRPIKPRGS